MLCIKALIGGRVQGVFFRESTRRKAETLDITGHAINLNDGQVEVIACGNDEDIKQLIEWLNDGPSYAEVNQLRWDVIDIPSPAGFTTG